ncbi:MAG: hypothetical protein ACRDKJ_12785 [Actinomycetota bacterium]
MRRVLAIAAVGLASVAYGIGLGSSSTFTASERTPEADVNIVRIADDGDRGYCPFDHANPTEESSA